MGKIKILKTGITSLNTDALVNAANSSLLAGGGVCGIIYMAAGASELQAACNAIGGCETGSAVITPGFRLKSKYIIHAVGPQWIDGKHKEPEQLYSAYQSALRLAVENKCCSIGFPLISAGIFGYPVDKAWRKAIQACLDFQKKNSGTPLDITFAVIDDQILDVGRKTLAELQKETTADYVEQLEEDSFETIKQKMVADSGILLDKKNHPMAGGLLSVICDQDIMKLIDKEKMVKIVESIFPGNILAENWLSRYAEILLRIIDVSKKKNKTDDRAQRYEKYLREALAPKLKNSTRFSEAQTILDILIGIYKSVACLLKYYTDINAEFVFEVDMAAMDQLNKAIQNIQGVGNQILGIEFVPVRQEERQYAVFLSWILEEILSKQEGLEREV